MARYYTANPVVMIWIYITFILFAELVYTYNYHRLWYSKVDWTGCLTPMSVYERLQGVAFKKCLQECGTRLHCKAVNYWRRRITCEFVGDTSGITVGIGDGPCAYVNREDMFAIPEVTGNCSTCAEYRVCGADGVCAIQGCPKPSVENARLYGNIWNVGAKVKIICSSVSILGIDTILAVCQQNGTWSMNTSVCRTFCAQTPPSIPNSIRNYKSSGVYTEATYTCKTGYVVEKYGHKTKKTTQTATCDSTAKTWFGLDFACVSECSLFDQTSYVQVSNMSLKFCMTRRNQTTAKTDCQQVGGLLRLDTIDKHAALQTFINNQPEYDGDLPLWVQGEYVDGQWMFDNGDPMPMDRNMWADDDGSKVCVALRGLSDYR